ncbi:MAG: IS30 family transposase [Gammaproteobacteria bacterium]
MANNGRQEQASCSDAQLAYRTSEITKAATVTSLKKYKNTIFTITSDNGCEFAKHEEISLALNADFYFAHPYSSWERGLNENTNGLVRQYIKKGSELTNVHDQHLDIIADKLNNRPRKTLGFKTPNEVFQE